MGDLPTQFHARFATRPCELIRYTSMASHLHNWLGSFEMVTSDLARSRRSRMEVVRGERREGCLLSLGCFGVIVLDDLWRVGALLCRELCRPGRSMLEALKPSSMKDAERGKFGL